MVRVDYAAVSRYSMVAVQERSRKLPLEVLLLLVSSLWDLWGGFWERQALQKNPGLASSSSEFFFTDASLFPGPVANKSGLGYTVSSLARFTLEPLSF